MLAIMAQPIELYTFYTTVIEPPQVAEITGTVSNYFGIFRYLDQATPCTTGFHPSFDVLPVEISPCPLGDAGWVAQVRQPSLVLVSSWIGRCWSLKKFIEQWPDDEWTNGHIMENEHMKRTEEAFLQWDVEIATGKSEALNEIRSND